MVGKRGNHAIITTVGYGYNSVKEYTDTSRSKMVNRRKTSVDDVWQTHVPREYLEKARLVVCSNAHTKEEAREFLDILGLLTLIEEN